MTKGCKRYNTSSTEIQDCNVVPRKFGQTHLKIMFTVLIFGQTRIVTFTVFSFGHLKFGHLNYPQCRFSALSYAPNYTNLSTKKGIERPAFRLKNP